MAGGILTLAALFFVLQRLWSQRDALAEWEPTWLLIGALVVGGILQGLAGFLLSGGWARLLRWCTDRDPDWRACHRLYGRTQLAKYIPGNIFHFVARHLSGRLEAYTHRNLICALTAENALLLTGAALTALPALYVLLAAWGGLSRGPAWLAVGVGLLGALLLAWCLFMRTKAGWASLPDRVSVDWRRFFGQLSPVLIQYLIFFHLAGLLLVGLVSLLHGWPGFVQAELLIGAAALSWLTGFVTPGAPAGIGVREAILLMLLAPLVGDPLGILVALLLRLISVSGDLWFFVFASFVGRRPVPLDTSLDGGQY